MQYHVPQFIDVEDTIVGPLTLKQFLILVVGGVILMLYYSIFKVGIFFFLFALPTVGVFGMIAFGKFNGRPALTSLPAAMQFLTTPKIRIFQRTSDKTTNIVKQAPTQVPEETRDSSAVPSRLKKLAYLLDQKTAEEERLIHSGQIKGKWINQI